MTARELLPGVYRVLADSAYVIADSKVNLQDLRDGILEYKTEKGRRARTQREMAAIKKAKRKAQSEVPKELEAAGRPDLIDPFLGFIDKYLTRNHSDRIIEALFNAEREVSTWAISQTTSGHGVTTGKPSAQSTANGKTK